MGLVRVQLVIHFARYVQIFFFLIPILKLVHFIFLILILFLVLIFYPTLTDLDYRQFFHIQAPFKIDPILKFLEFHYFDLIRP